MEQGSVRRRAGTAGWARRPRLLYAAAAIAAAVIGTGVGATSGLPGAVAAPSVGVPGQVSPRPVAVVVDAAVDVAVAAHPGGAGVVHPVGLVAAASTAAGGPDRSGTEVPRAATGVLAQGGAAGGSGQRIAAVLDRLRQWVVYFVTALASVVFAIGGLRYLLANGDLSEIDAAKRAFKGAAVGYGIALLAQTLASILSSVVGGAQ